MATDEQPFVSVVTPVYNGEKYLAEAIEGVLGQTYENWEYVVSDNRSTDGTREIVEEYAARDPRIRLIRHDDHVPIVQSWNRSIRLISPKSKYAKVLCADDWFFPECLERMVALAEEHPSVGVVSAYRIDGRLVGLAGIPHSMSVIPGREFCRGRFLRELPFVFGSPTSVMFRSDVVRKRDPFYDDSNLHADTGACYDVLQDSDLGFVHQVLTYTRRHDGAFTSYTRRVGTYKPLHLEHLLTYGPGCMTPEELGDQIGVRVAAYAGFLVRGTHRFRDREFREFHLAALRRLRSEIGGSRMASAAAKAILRRLGRGIRRTRNRPTPWPSGRPTSY